MIKSKLITPIQRSKTLNLHLSLYKPSFCFSPFSPPHSEKAPIFFIPNLKMTSPMIHDLEKILASVGISSFDDDAPSFIEDVFGPNFLCKCNATGCRHPIPRTKEDDEVLSLSMEMPGLTKENVKLTVTGNMLVVFGNEEFNFRGPVPNKNKGFKSGRETRRYCAKFVLSDTYKLHMIMAEMKNEVLKVVVPKYKEKEDKVMVLSPVFEVYV